MKCTKMKLKKSFADEYYVTNKTTFVDNGNITKEDVKTCFDFAWDMSFGKKGEHRNIRSGGSHRRKGGERFINAFHGKLAEYGVYNYFRDEGYNVSKPDISVYGLGQWDDVDIEIEGKKCSIKATKEFGQLLLLETRDWDSEGRFKPDIERTGGIFDYFIFARYSPDGEKLMKFNKLMYSDEVDKTELEKIITSENWTVNVVGFISREDLAKDIIGKGQIIPRGAMLNGKSKMDAENYYVQSGDLLPINLFLP